MKDKQQTNRNGECKMTNGQQIAQTTIQQMGGTGKLAAMIGANKFGYDANGTVSFHFKGSRKANVAKIELTPMDEYKVTLYKFSATKGAVEVATFGSYCDTLKANFESATGLYLSL